VYTEQQKKRNFGKQIEKKNLERRRKTDSKRVDIAFSTEGHEHCFGLPSLHFPLFPKIPHFPQLLLPRFFLSIFSWKMIV